MEKPKQIKSIWYAKDSMDCYTFILKGKLPNGNYEYLGTSITGLGVSMFGECEEGNHLGKHITFNSLGASIKKHVIARLGE
jgi:hypothetical protein